MTTKKKLNEVQTVTTLQDSEFITVTLADGSVGKIKKSDLYPIVTPSLVGLMDNLKYPLYNFYPTVSSLCPALLIKTGVKFYTNSYNVAHLDIADAVTWNYAFQLSFKIKIRLNTTSINLDIIDLSTGDLISSVIGFLDDSSLLNVQVNFKSSVNLSNGYIVGNCLVCQSGMPRTLRNYITGMEVAEKYTGGNYSIEKLVTL